MTSELATESTVLIVRPNLLARHRYITGGLWFAMFAFFAACIFMRTTQMAGGDFILAVYAGLSAILPGLVLGAKILDNKVTKSAWGATWRGALIVLLSYIVFSAMLAFPSAMTSGPANFLVVLFFGAVFSGWVTVPIGCIGAVGLYKLRDWKGRPRGCAIHQYRAQPSAIELQPPNVP